MPKNWCFWTVVLEKTLENPLDCKEMKLVNPKGHQYWIFIGRTDAEAEAPIFWPLDEKNQLIGKDPDAGKDEGRRRRGQPRMVGWYHWLNVHEFEQTPRDGEGQGSLVCWCLWAYKVGHEWETGQQQLYLGKVVSHYVFSETYQKGFIILSKDFFFCHKKNKILSRSLATNKHSTPSPNLWITSVLLIMLLPLVAHSYRYSNQKLSYIPLLPSVFC